MIDIAQKLWTFLDKPSRVRLILYLFPMLISAALEMASIGMILPLVQVFTHDGNQSDISWLNALPFNVPAEDLLLYMVAAFAGFFILKNIAIFSTVYFVTRFTYGLMAGLMQRLFELYLYRPYAFHLQRNSAEIIRNLNSGVSSSFDALRLGVTVVLETCLAAAAFLLLIFIEPAITLILTFSLLTVGFLIDKTLTPYLRQWGSQSHIAEAKIIQAITESTSAIKDIKIFNCYPYVQRIYSKETDSYAHSLTNASIANQSPRFLIEIFIIIGILALILVLNVADTPKADAISIIGLFGMASLRLMPSLNRIVSGIATLRRYGAAIDAIYEDLQDGQKCTQVLRGTSLQPISFEKEIRIENINFLYPNVDGLTLKNIDFVIPRGSAVGLVGSSGAGKSTLTDVIMGLFAPTSGHILVDDVDVTLNGTDWQQHIGYVPQQIYLNDDSIRQNIAFGVDASEIDDARVKWIINAVQLDDLVDALPDHIDTVIGENGVRLSGGQRQRIGIARALYRDPSLLVLDEATSALDTETEKEIAGAIEKLAQTKTLIIVAHRLSTIRFCDKIIFLKSGEIIGQGSFDELFQTNPDFQRFVESGKVRA